MTPRSNPRSGLSLVETLALSIALIGPTLVLAANGQGIASEVRQPLWLVFAIGLVGVSAVGYAFARLLPLTAGPGSAYLAVQATLGLVAGRLAGVALLGAYLGFAVATPAAIVSFFDTVVGAPDPAGALARRMAATTVALALAGLIVTRPNATIMRLLLIVEGAGILMIAALAGAVLMGRGAPLHPHAAAAVGQMGGFHLLDGVVVAFFSWAGFESCMTLAGNSANPKRDMPLALGLSTLLSGLLFVAMFAVVEMGFDGRLGGRAALALSQNALSDLGAAYIGRWCGVGFGVAALCSAFACLVAAVTASSSILRSLTPNRPPRSGSALPLLIIGSVWALECLLAIAKPFPQFLPETPIALYGFFGAAGAVCIMIAYLLVLAGCVRALLTRQVAAGSWELVVPLVGLAFIALALVDAIANSGSTAASTLLATWFCVGGLVVALAAEAWLRSRKTVA